MPSPCIAPPAQEGFLIILQEKEAQDAGEPQHMESWQNKVFP